MNTKASCPFSKQSSPFLDPTRVQFNGGEDFLANDIRAIAGDGGVVWQKLDEHGDGFWVVTKMADCVALFDEEGALSSADGAFLVNFPAASIEMLGNAGIIFMDGPEHERLRLIVSRIFKRSYLAKSEAWLTDVAHDLILNATGKKINAVEEICDVFPVRAISNFFGFDDASTAIMLVDGKRLGEALASGDFNFLTSSESTECIGRVMTSIMDLISRQKISDEKTALHDMLYEDDGSLTLNDIDSAVIVLQLFIGAFKTVRDILSTITYRVAIMPGILDELRENPGRIDAFLDEVLRLDPPTRMLRKNAGRDLLVGGQQIKKGDKIAFYYASANIDNDYDLAGCPAVFNHKRETQPYNMTFGRGKHFCLGSHFAKLQMRVYLTALVQHASDIRLAGNPLREPTYMFNSWERLEVIIVGRDG